jgi:putative peptidoglycan lipid II flippase
MFLVLTIIASTLVIGSVTVFQFAYNIQFFPVGIIGVSFAIAVFPTLSELSEQDQLKKFASVVSSSALQLLYLLIPMSLLFLILRAQIVRVVVGAGEFDWAATIATADTLAFFALTFVPQALVFLLARAFYALRDTVTPLTIAVVSSLVGILTAYLLKDDFGVIALAMAYSLAIIVNASLLWVTLRQRLGTLQESEITTTVLKLAAAAIASGVTMQALKPFVVEWITLDTFFAVFAQGLIAGGAGLVVYGVCAHFLRVPEQQEFLKTFTRKVLRKAKTEEVVTAN